MDSLESTAWWPLSDTLPAFIFMVCRYVVSLCDVHCSDDDNNDNNNECDDVQEPRSAGARCQPERGPPHLAGYKEGDRSEVSCTMPLDIQWRNDWRLLTAGPWVQVQNNVFRRNILFFSLTAEHSGIYSYVVTNAASATESQ